MKTKNVLNSEISFSKSGGDQLEFVSKLLSMTLRSGLNIVEALILATESSSGSLRKALENVAKSVESGRTLSDSIAEYPRIFSQLYINTLRVGETSGTLPESLDTVSLHLEKERTLISRVKEVMIYPVVVVCAAFVLGLAMSFLVLPKITPFLAQLDVELPFTTKVLIWFSNFIKTYAIFILGGAPFVVMAFTWLLRQKYTKPATSWITLHLPVVKNISKGVNLTRFCLTLSTLLRSGVDILKALDISKDIVNNHYYSQALTEVEKKVRAGRTLSECLEEHKNLFPSLVTHMIGAGERSGRLDETLEYLGNFYEERVNTTTKSLPAIIEPVILLTIGAGIAFLALAIITPIFKLTGSIQQ